MESKKLITDFIHKYRKYIAYAVIVWFVITAVIAYSIVANSEDINVMMSFGYAKAKFRSLFFFLPDNWLSGISVKAGVGHFKKLIATWKSVFDEYGWKMYLYVFITFAASFLVCTAVIYKYFQYQIKKFKDGIMATGKLLKLNEFQKKYPEAFGKYLNFAGLNLSEQIFKTPFYVWGNDESLNKVLGQFLEDARAKKRKVIIFEEGNNLYKNLGTENDILLNPLEESGLSWDFFADMKHYDVLIKELMKKINVREKHYVIEDLIKHLIDLDVGTKEFFQILCFASFKQIESELKAFANIQDNKNSFIKIRNQIADDLYCFKTLFSKSKKGISFYEYYESISDKSILWISCGNNVHLKSMIPFMKNVIDPNIIKIISGKNLITFTTNTIVINDSLDDSYYNSSKLLLSGVSDKKSLIASFGDTLTEYPSFLGVKYKKTFEKIINDKAKTGDFFQYARTDDVLQI